jgi:hypothetical protein
MNLRKYIRSILSEAIQKKSLKKTLDSDEAYAILDSTAATGTMWTQGACAILAFALNKAYGYPVYVIYDNDLKQADHFVVKTPQGTYIDYRGEQKDIVSKFKEDEMLWDKDLSLVPYEKSMNISDIVIDDNASQKLANLIVGEKKTINEGPIWNQGGVLLIKGSPLEDGSQRLYATSIKNLIELKPGVKMATLGDEFFRLKYNDQNELRAFRIAWKNEPTLAKMLNFKNHKLSVVLNNNKVPLHWETLQYNNIGVMLNKLGSQILGVKNINFYN